MVFLEIPQHLGLRPATLLKKRPWHRCFPVNFAKFLRIPFVTEHLWWLLLKKRLEWIKGIAKTFICPNSLYIVYNSHCFSNQSHNLLKLSIWIAYVGCPLVDPNGKWLKNIKLFLTSNTISCLNSRKTWTIN